MNDAHYVVPRPVGKLLSRLPVFPGSVLFVTALNTVIKPLLPLDVCHALHGRSLRIHVRDAELRFDFLWQHNKFVAWTNHGTPDLTISANAYDFLLLMQKREDPDTLFFSRRLVMEGDTDLGLLIKNTLDAIELPAFGQDLSPLSLLRRARTTR